LGRAKKLRKKSARWEELIAEHRRKIAQELVKLRLHRGRISKWEKEIENWQRQIEQARKRLPGRSKKRR
jgi:hypothetical protein